MFFKDKRKNSNHLIPIGHANVFDVKSVYIESYPSALFMYHLSFIRVNTI